MLFVFKSLSRCPLWLLHLLGAALGWLSYATSRSYRHRLRANVAQAGLPPRVGRLAVAHAGRMVAELPRLWMGEPVPLEWSAQTVVEDALAEGRGVIYLTPHLGCFEVTPHAVPQRVGPSHGPVTVLYRPARQRWLAQLMLKARSRPGLSTAPTNLAGVRQMIRTLRQGHSVGLLPDQVPPQGMGIWAPFFGKSAYTMTLAARLAQQTGAAVVLVWAERLPWGAGYRMHLSRLPALSPDVAEAVGQINAAMERLILACPEQYLWGYARYKVPAAQPAADGGPT